MAHANARLTLHGRRLLVERITAGWTITAAAAAAGISRQTGSKWWWRARTGSLVDRSSAVHHQARRHPPELVAWLCARRRELRVGPHILGWEAGMARSSVYAILRREGISRLDRLEPRPQIVRYERERPGELVHLDTKMLGRIGPGGGHRAHGVAVKDKHRGIGWNRVHLAIDDHSRLAYAEELPDESPATTAGFLERAWRFYGAHGITVERILTDNGGCYRSLAVAETCDALGIGHRFTRPYRPQTNGKAERLVRTLMREWAYAKPFAATSERVVDLPRFLDFYNRRRPHWSLAGQPPISRVPVNNLMGKNT
jgi:transposase InsO family protein